MARKVFISVLGPGPYRECTYISDSFKCTSRYIQLATLKHIVAIGDANNDQWTRDDIGLILLTEKSEREQWLVGKSTDNNNNIVCRAGLKEELDLEGLPVPVLPLKIVDGKNEDEIWSIFDVLYNAIKEDDELYFDITHAFRYLPMLLLVLINYAKFLKNATVKSITYGNFMAEGAEKPIMDLTSLSTLQDWTFAAGQYIESGNVKKLVEISRQELKPILKRYKGANASATAINGFITGLEKVVAERQTCRGMSIIRSESIKGLNNSISQIQESVIKPLTPIVEKIKSSLVFFDEEVNAKNGYAAAKWCYDNGLYQQAATILQEFVVSFFCLRHDIRPDDEKRREIINQAFVLKFNHQEEDIGDNWSKVKEENKTTLKSVLSDDLLECIELVNMFNNLSEVRNDLNHSGMRSRRVPLAPKNIKENIEKCLNGFGILLFDYKSDSTC